MGDLIDILVAGHLCLDLIPGMSHVSAEDMTTPGRLYTIDPIAVSTGGAVSNTGLALHRLGVNVQLLATVGEDLIGQMILMYLRLRDPKLVDLIKIKSGQPSSSTIALSPANSDRTFLHCTGTNDSFGVADIDFDLVRQAKIFHLGYPTLLPHVVEDDGEDLQAIYAKAKATGVVTSLDMAQPDPNGRIAHLNWPLIFQRTLPNVDIFVPSIEEMVLTLRRDDYDRWMPNISQHLTRDYLCDLADELLAMGVVITGFKLGEMGMYLKTGKAELFQRLSRLNINIDQWADQELWIPAFEVNVKGTTGAGDSAYAGFLAAMLKNSSPLDAMRWACAVGACNVEAPDATSGIKTWAETEARLATDWATRSERLPEWEDAKQK
jgi:sugar/nucleoside kinase (ribokinase family)